MAAGRLKQLKLLLWKNWLFSVSSVVINVRTQLFRSSTCCIAAGLVKFRRVLFSVRMKWSLIPLLMFCIVIGPEFLNLMGDWHKT